MLDRIYARAAEETIPLSVHVDLTYRCNERCVHCYLEHESPDELSTAEWSSAFEEFAEAGTLNLTISGGEPFLRGDLFELIERARALGFLVKLKTNGTLIGPAEADRLRGLHVAEVDVSIYSAEAAEHDGITRVAGSLERSLNALRLMKERGLKVRVNQVLMRPNGGALDGVRRLAEEMGIHYSVDAQITPKLDGDRGLAQLNVGQAELAEIMRRPEYAGNVEEFCARPKAADEALLDERPCLAGHASCYVSPAGEVRPCVQYPVSCGNVRERRFGEIWRESAELREIRGVRMRDLNGCAECDHLSVCNRCPGLALMEGDFRGVSSLDCRKAAARTGLRPSHGWTQMNTD